MTSEDCLQVLTVGEPAPHPAAMPKDQTEEPDFAHCIWLVGKANRKLGEVDLRLLTWRGLEPAFERRLGRWPDLSQKSLYRGIAALIPKLLDLTEKASPGQPRKLGHALLQIVLVSIQFAPTKGSWPVNRWLKSIRKPTQFMERPKSPRNSSTAMRAHGTHGTMMVCVSLTNVPCHASQCC